VSADREDAIGQDLRAMRNAPSIEGVEAIARAMRGTGHWTPEAEREYATQIHKRRVVVPLGQARSASTNVRCHRCGGEWWRLIRRHGAGDVASGAVILHAAEHGDQIVGYSGYFECVECGATR
jgi:hypothetical protein